MRRLLLILSCLAGLFAASAQQLTTGTYYIKSVISPNYVVDLNAGNCFNGNNIQLWERNNSSAQHWFINVLSDGTVMIANDPNIAWMIDVNGSGVYNGNNIQIWLQNNTKAQRWIPEYSNGAYVFHSALNYNYVLDLNGANIFNGNNIQLWESNGSNAQRWYLERVNQQSNSGYAPVYTAPMPQQPTSYPCGVCHQTGRCSNCNGTGASPNHAPGIYARCGACGGTGICATCHGTGYSR